MATVIYFFFLPQIVYNAAFPHILSFPVLNMMNLLKWNPGVVLICFSLMAKVVRCFAMIIMFSDTEFYMFKYNQCNLQ